VTVQAAATVAELDLHRSEKLKVGFVVHPFEGSPDSLSTHIWVHQVARSLVKTCSSIVYTGRGRAPSPRESRDGVRYRRITIPSDSRVAKRIFTAPLLWRLKGSVSFRSRWYYCGHALQIARDARLNKCDIVHILNLSHFAPIVRALNPKTRIVLHMHAEWLTRLEKHSIERRLESVDRIISCSDFVTDQIRFAFPQFASRCATVYNGVDVEHFSPNCRRAEPDGSKRLLYVGGVAPHKGLHVLLDALPGILKRHPQARLDIVGPPSKLPLDWLPTLGDPARMADLLRFYDEKGYVAHLKEQIARLGLEDSVVFWDAVTRDELARRYREADVFVFPSLWNELFGMPTAEAMSSGVPVVASRIAGLPEVVQDGVTGLLVPPGNSSALADAVIRLLDDSDLRIAMGAAGRQRVLQNFTWDKIAQAMMRHYDELTVAER
jgi:glycosyltransferase involved in cell wall biosynthesis